MSRPWNIVIAIVVVALGLMCLPIATVAPASVEVVVNDVIQEYCCPSAAKYVDVSSGRLVSSWSRPGFIRRAELGHMKDAPDYKLCGACSSRGCFVLTMPLIDVILTKAGRLPWLSMDVYPRWIEEVWVKSQHKDPRYE